MDENQILDNQFADLRTKYGAYFQEGKWIVNLWQPLAKKVELIIYDKDNQNKIISKYEGVFVSPNWTWELSKDYEGHFYQYKISQENGLETIALDPFAKSMASFNWGGNTKNVGKAAFVKVIEKEKLYETNNDKVLPIIYEAHIRDLTSLRKDVEIPGSFNAIIESNFGEYIKKLGFTAIQFLPIHSCYSLDENDKKILNKGDGQGWNTNYNWGYDPHNYFSINGWYSSNPHDPYSRINEFKKVVEHFHSYDIQVIIDVVYNHLMTNDILNNALPNYYFRKIDKDKNIMPVNLPALASERLMTRRIIVESLEWFVKVYDVDGFRFDLSCFIDKETIEIASKRLKKIKSNIILHGEAWQFSDLEYSQSFIKGINDNEIEFAYFNDCTRNAIKGDDDHATLDAGIIGGNLENHFENYLAAIIGNLSNVKKDNKHISNSKYTRFTKQILNNLQYAACHDGHTLWDKVNLTTKKNIDFKIEKLRQALIMQLTTQGKQLLLAGTELMHSKPNDSSGQDFDKIHTSKHVIDFWNESLVFNHNTYKQTDYVNGLKYNNLNNFKTRKYVYEFLEELIWFRKQNQHFNLKKAKEVEDFINFNYIDNKNGIIDFTINIISKSKIRVIHNFTNYIYKYTSENGEMIFDSKLIKQEIGINRGHSSQILKEKNE